MSREIDERIVAMYFDNRNFESGAQQTLKTLEQLKQSCNMEGVGKGFEAIGEVSKKMKLDKITQGISKMKTAFNGVGNIIKKAFSLTPFDNMMHALNNFRHNFLNKIIGFDVAGKLASSIENALRSLTIAPISAGWQQYENTMDSIKTIMSSTGENIDVVKAKLGEMTDYANKTIYSLNDMTSNLGKFTNNGVKLDDATNAMIGLANATADAGQGAQQASMAMYNVSQAIGVGKMTTIDWKSLENANIATQKLKKTFIETAVASGSLEQKVVKVKDATTGLMKEEVQYWTKAEKGSKAEQVTVENFRETLNKGWLDKKAMLDTFAIYSGQLSKQDLLSLGYSKEDAERFYKIGQDAMQAAQEVRTFTKMMDAARESVQSSWATSFEYIFGDMQEGTNLWTSLNEKIDGVLSSAAENRNNILLSWRGLMKDEDGQVRKIEDVYKRRRQALEYNYEHKLISSDVYLMELEKLENGIGNPELWVDYREIAIGTFMDLFDTIKMVAGQVKGAWEDVFGAFDSNSLKGITSRIRGIVTSIKDWLGSSDDVSSRISKLRKGLSGVFNVLKIGWNVLKTVISAGWNMIKPFLDPILNLFEMFGKAMDLTGANNLSEIIQKLSNKFKSLVKTVKELGWSGVMGKVGNWFSDVWQKMKTSVKGWLNDNGFGGVVDWFRNIRTGIEDGIKSVQDWWNNPDNKIAGFFKGMYDTVTGWFKSGVDENGHETRSPIAQFFYRISSDVDSAYKAVVKWWNGSGIPKFFEDLWNSVTSWFTPKTVVGKQGNTWTEDSPIVAFFKGIWEGIQSAFDELTAWWESSGIPEFFEGIWNSVTGWFEPKTVVGKQGNTWTEDSPIVAFFKGIWEGLQSIWTDISEWWNDETGIAHTIRETFTGIWDSVSGVFKESADTGEIPIVSFFKNIPGALSEAWESVTKWFEDNGITKFFTDAWDWLMGVIGVKSGDTGTSNNDISSMVRDPLNQIAGAGISDSGSMKRLVDNTVGGNDEFAKELDKKVEELPIVQFFNKIKTALMNAWEGITGWEGWTAIGDFFNRTLRWLSDLFTGASGNDDSTEVDANLERKRNLLESIGSFLKGTIEALADMVREVGTSDTAKAIFETLRDVITFITDIISMLAEWGSRVAHGFKTGDWHLSYWDVSLPIFAIVGVIVKTIIDLKKNSDLAKIAEAKGTMSGLGTQILQFAAGIGIVALAISTLGKMEFGELAKGVVTVGIIAAALTILTKNMTDLQNSITDEPVKAWERVIGKLITMAGMAGMLWILMKELPSLIGAIAEAKKIGNISGDDIMKPLLGVAGAIAGLMLAFGLLNKMAPQGLDIGATLSTTIAIVSSVIAAGAIMMGTGGLFQLFEELERTITGDSSMEENMRKFFNKIRILAVGIHDFVAALLGGGTDAEKLLQQTEGIDGLSQVAERFDLNKVLGVLRLMDMMERLTEVAKGIDEGKLENMKTAMGNIGDALNKFVWIVLGDGEEYLAIHEFLDKGDEGVESVNKVIDTVKQISGLLEQLSNITFGEVGVGAFIDWTNGVGFAKGNNVDAFIAAVNKVIDAAGNLHDGSNIKFDGLSIVKKLYESIQQNFDNPEADLPEFNAQPIVDSILTAIGAQDKIIAFAIRGMIQDGINLLNSGSPEYSYDLSGILGSDSPLSNFFSVDDPNSLFGGINFDEIAGSAEKAIGEATKSMNLDKIAENAQQNYEGFSLKVTGIDFSSMMTDSDGDGVPDVMKAIDEELANLQTQLDESYDLQLTLTPVIDMTGFGGEYAKLSAFIGEQTPISMSNSVNIGDQALAIDDANIVAEIRSVRTELQTASAALQRVLWAVDNSLGSKINGVTSAVSRLKLNVSLKQIDDGLGRSASNSALTGVSAPWDPPNYIYDLQP